MQEEEGLDVDIILVVISAENVPVPQSFVDQIYKEANMKKKRKHVLFKNKYVYLQIWCAITSQIQIIFYSNNTSFLSEIPVFIVATKVDECKLSEEGVEKKTEQIIQSFGTTPYKVLTCKNYLSGDTVPDIDKDISIITFLKKVHHLKTSSYSSVFGEKNELKGHSYDFGKILFFRFFTIHNALGIYFSWPYVIWVSRRL